LYNHNLDDIYKLVKLFEESTVDIIYIIDNSPSDKLGSLSGLFSKIKYFYFPQNLGFGKGHNIALKKSKDEDYCFHFIVNPDIYFLPGTIENMINYMQNDTSIGMMMPQVLNDDGTIQYLPKLIPAPWDVIIRIFKLPKRYYNNFISKYELRGVNEIVNIPILSGCFTIMNISAIKEVGIFDERFFMYFEDWDLSRRINQKYKTIYFPYASVFHGYENGAKRSFKLFKIFFFSYIKYFNKWGWFYDYNRKRINNSVLIKFQN
jgi:GT2 family glycosyltransferase